MQTSSLSLSASSQKTPHVRTSAERLHEGLATRRKGTRSNVVDFPGAPKRTTPMKGFPDLGFPNRIPPPPGAASN